MLAAILGCEDMSACATGLSVERDCLPGGTRIQKSRLILPGSHMQSLTS